MKLSRLAILVALLFVLPLAHAQTEHTYRLFNGTTLYINNPDGKAFDLTLDVRDLNIFANGPREVLFKVYDPDGRPVVREVIPDDGCTSSNFPDRIGGWDHELQYYANLYAKGTNPSFRWSAWSDPNRLKTLVARTFKRSIKGGAKGVYRVVLAGTHDHYVTIKLDPELKFGVVGHPTWMHGHGDMLRKSYIYVPAGTNGLFFAVAEPDMPRTRHFRLTGPDGKVLFDGMAPGGYEAAGGKAWQQATVGFGKGAQYEGKLLTLEVSPGLGDYLVKVTLQQPRKGPWRDYVGMGSLAVFAPDPETAMAIRGGTRVKDGLVFWHPFQVRFYDWLQAHPLNGSDAEKALRGELETLFNYVRLIETSDGRGTRTWTNWAYAFGYYGCKLWRPSWVLMKRDDVPQDLKDIIREAVIMGADRLSFATGIERVNGNAFSQIPVALWYAKETTGDKMIAQRFEVFWQRWKTEGWGRGAGLSRSGDSQEHFAHDMHYGSYIMDNWRGGTWVKPGILEDAKDDPRWKGVMDRYRDLYSYLYCREPNGRSVPANPWSARTHVFPHHGADNWEMDGRKWKGDPGPDLTVSVNGGNEWFAARRKDYYILTFHGRLAPEWMCRTFNGQLGFGGGIICQLTVPGKGPVLASTLHESYGVGLDPSNWRNFHIHSIVGQMWDGRPLVSGISECPDAQLKGNTVTSSGEVRDCHVKVLRSYTFNPDSIDCSVALAESDYAKVLSIWSHGRHWSEVALAYEMIPVYGAKSKPPVKVTLLDAKGAPMGEASDVLTETGRIRIDRGGWGVDIVLEKPMKVKLGANHTVLIKLTGKEGKLVPADKVALKYKLVPFRGQ